MIIIELTYKKSLEYVDKYLDAHKQFLKVGYDQHCFLASGPKTPRNGGVILSTFTDLTTCQAFMKQDPFAQQDIAIYHFIQFDMTICEDRAFILQHFQTAIAR